MDIQRVKEYLSDDPPRIENPEVQGEMLNLIIPRFTRMILCFMPLIMVTVFSSIFLFMLPKLRLKAEYDLAFSDTKNIKGHVQHVAVHRGSKGSITYTYKFEFILQGKGAQPETVKGYCFSGSNLYQKGETCNIVYVINQPTICRIENCRLNPVSLWMFLIMILVCISSTLIPFIIVGIRKGWLNRILENGILTKGKVVMVKKGGKGAILIDVAFRYDDYDYKARVVPVAIKGLFEFAEKCKQEDVPVTVLFLRDKPKKIFLMDYLDIAK